MIARLLALFILCLVSGLAVRGEAALQDGSATTSTPASPRYELIVLGIAQDGGLPHVGCDKPCCVEARRTGRSLYPASLGLIDHEEKKLCLIEATPHIEAQLAMLHEASGQHDRGRAPVDAVVLTHAHMGHYLGLAHFGREVAATTALPVHVSPRFAEFLRTNGPWSQLVELGQISLAETTAGTAFQVFEGVSITPIAVPHRDEFSDTMAFRIHGPERTVLFVPDIDAWTSQPGVLAELLDGVNVAYLDATFYDGRELPDRVLKFIRHPFMTDTMERLKDEAMADPDRLRFIHLNHTNPVLHDRALRDEVRKRGFRIAEQGERIQL